MFGMGGFNPQMLQQLLGGMGGGGGGMPGGGGLPGMVPGRNPMELTGPAPNLLGGGGGAPSPMISAIGNAMQRPQQTGMPSSPWGNQLPQQIQQQMQQRGGGGGIPTQDPMQPGRNRRPGPMY